ncbi:MAG: hypothetical protein JXD22_08735 [Sedimentisphaerales bacterium]|nr:hypothetical protein [Sedimentisphaerales bacterium]
MKILSLCVTLLLLNIFSPTWSCAAAESESEYPQRLVARTYNSGFDLAHDTYNAISTASDGTIIYVLSSQSIDVGGQMYCYDPASDKIRHLADLTEICGEKGTKAIPQGKVHCNFYQRGSKLYFSTHAGFYEIIDGMEMMVKKPPEGYKLYPGGHLLSYDIVSGDFDDLAIAPYGEAFLTTTMDTNRGHIYAITWPKGYFIHYDPTTKKIKNLGTFSAAGETGIPGKTYRTLCRSMVVDPRDGTVYFTTSTGKILSYSPDADSLQTVEAVDMKKDYFGSYDPSSAGHMGYNWRRVIWYEPENAAYGVHGNSGYLFRFDPRKPSLEVIERLTSIPSKRSGMFDQFSYGYLGFDLGSDGHTLYYLTGGPIYIDGKRLKGKDRIAMGAARGKENLHLVTYDIPAGKYTDHGPIFYKDGQRPLYVNSIAVGKDGAVYTLARITENGRMRADLIKINNPFRNR